MALYERFGRHILPHSEENMGLKGLNIYLQFISFDAKSAKVKNQSVQWLIYNIVGSVEM